MYPRVPGPKPPPPNRCAHRRPARGYSRMRPPRHSPLNRRPAAPGRWCGGDIASSASPWESVSSARSSAGVFSSFTSRAARAAAASSSGDDGVHAGKDPAAHSSTPQRQTAAAAVIPLLAFRGHAGRTASKPEMPPPPISLFVA